jgi:hypothetical protein
MLDLCLVKFHSRTTSMYLDDLQVANHMGDEKGSDFPSHDVSCVKADLMGWLPPFVKVVVVSTYAATSKSPRSFSGFSQTLSGRSQSLISFDQRLGLASLAAS